MRQKINVLFFACITTLFFFHSPMAESANKASDLASALRTEVQKFDGTVGIYIKDLTTGQEFDINANTIFPTASTSKIIVAMTAYKNMRQLPPGFRKNVPALVSDMITCSSNSAFEELTNQLSSTALAKSTKTMGLRSTAIHNDTAFAKTNYHSITTPRDMGKALEKLLGGRYLNDADSQQVLRYMMKGVYNDEIPRLLPVNTLVAHKPGELDNVVCDVGIVFNSKRPYLISVFTKTDIGNGFSSDFIAGIASITDTYFSNLPHRSLPKSLSKNIPKL